MKLIVEPRATTNWDTFCKETPEWSIALDGYVEWAPNFNNRTYHTNFNHHEWVNRIATRSTSWQILIAIKQWFSEILRNHNSQVYVNDSDQDVCLSTWLLWNHERLEWQKSEPILNRLIQITDILDVTSWTYPISTNAEIVQEMAWIFDPHVQARVSGILTNIDSSGMEEIIQHVGERISQHTLGRGEKLELDTKYEIIWWGKNWKMLIEEWFYARSALTSSWIYAFVSVKELWNWKYLYSLGKISPFVSFPIQELFRVLNEAEWISESNQNKWWWSDTIGGSPRDGGSNLSPEKLEEIINKYLESK